jgi:hypothetical protein
MASYSRVIFLSAAAIGISAILSISAPAIASEGGTSVTNNTSSSFHASRSRIAARNYRRHIAAIRSDLGCSGVWCGRQFVLMVGIAY